MKVIWSISKDLWDDFRYPTSTKILDQKHCGKIKSLTSLQLYIVENSQHNPHFTCLG